MSAGIFLALDHLWPWEHMALVLLGPCTRVAIPPPHSQQGQHLFSEITSTLIIQSHTHPINFPQPPSVTLVAKRESDTCPTHEPAHYHQLLLASVTLSHPAPCIPFHGHLNAFFLSLRKIFFGLRLFSLFTIALPKYNSVTHTYFTPLQAPRIVGVITKQPTCFPGAMSFTES
jgi:hypothetical protein